MSLTDDLGQNRLWYYYYCVLSVNKSLLRKYGGRGAIKQKFCGHFATVKKVPNFVTMLDIEPVKAGSGSS